MPSKKGGRRVETPLPGVRSGQTLGNSIISGINTGAHLTNVVANQIRAATYNDKKPFQQQIKGKFDKGYGADKANQQKWEGGKSKKLRKPRRKSRKTRRKSNNKRSTKRSRK